ncbi:MAG: diguanylate cyclase [Pseudomonadales bacterium]
MIQLTLWTISPLLVTLVAVGIYLRLARKPRVPGMPAILALLATVVFWSGCQFLESLFADLETKLLALKLSVVGIALAPVLWFLFALTYTRRQMHVSALVRNLLSVIPLITIVLAVTNDWHQLMWRDARLMLVQGFVALITERGPWFYVHVLYAYGLMMVGTTILAYGLATTTRLVRPVIGVVLAPLVVFAANLLFLLPGNPVPWFDITTLGLVAGALILDLAVLRYGVFDDIPVLRDRILEQLGDGVVVVNQVGIIVDVNQAALALLQSDRASARRTPLAALLPSLELERLIAGAADSLEVQARGRCYDVTASRLDGTSPASDVVLVFRDVTVRRDTELALRVAQDELQRLAHTDSLTGLNNRRLFMDRLDEETRRVQRHGGCLSVLLVDLDHFKLINDRHGHGAGDRVLRAAAQQTLAVKRLSDVAARVGGEEFALLLPATDAVGAVRLAQRLRSAIETIDTGLLVSGAEPVTASIGVATVTAGRDDPIGVLRRADQALYQAKHDGRNRVCEAA